MSEPINTYPEMNQKIVGILKVSADPFDLYVAQRIEDLEEKLEQAQQALVLIEDESSHEDACTTQINGIAREALSGDIEPVGAQVREPVEWFAEQMEKRLKENDHKGGWNDSGIVYLFRRLKEEVEELANTMPDELEYLIKESTDVANFAMMIADNARRLADINTGERSNEE